MLNRSMVLLIEKSEARQYRCVRRREPGFRDDLVVPGTQPGEGWIAGGTSAVATTAGSRGVLICQLLVAR